MRILIPTRFLKRRRPVAEPTPPGIPNTVLWGDYSLPFVPPSYQANIPEPSPSAETPEDPFAWMTPRLPMGVPWTPETEQKLALEWVKWAQWKARAAE